MPSTGFLDGFGFETLIAPCDGDDFLRTHWNRSPRLEQRGLPDFYDGLLSIHDVDRVLASYSRNGSDTLDRDLDIDAALRRLEQGAALVLEDAQNQIPALALVCRSIQAELGFRCSMAIEVTMPSNKPHPFEAVPSHIFVLQIAGRRDWRTESSELPDDFVLEAGDLLYLPPGCVCQHRSTGDESITAILTVSPPRWVDMTGDKTLIDGISIPETLSEPLPPRWIHRGRAEIVSELSRRWRHADDMISVEAAVAQLIQDEVRAFPLDLRGRLIETLNPREIRDDTLFAGRTDLLWTIEQNGVVTRLIAGPMTIDLRPALNEAVEFCLTSQRFALPDIPGGQPVDDYRSLLNTLTRNVLVRRISA